jgi:endonuclease/exonuclease/phosphatase family metal-dependent hydrolase
VRVRVKTWNCFGMAQKAWDAITANRAPAHPRFHDAALIDACASVDVLCIQELLSRDAQLFFDGLGRRGFASTVRDDNRLCFRTGSARGSGLGIGSRVPPLHTTQWSFGGAPRAVGWDRLARKGALHVRLALEGGLEVDVVTAHLQAGEDARAEAVRLAQLDELAQFVARTSSPARPLVVAGDFNIDGRRDARGSAPYARLRAALPGCDDLGAQDDHVTFDPHPERNTLARSLAPGGTSQRLDYIFFRPAAGGRMRVDCTGLHVTLHEPLAATPPQAIMGAAPGPAYASDHYALTATFEY